MSLGNNTPDNKALPENTPSAANGSSAAANPAAGQPAGSGPDVSKQVQDVLTSEIAVAAMLNRLKQSIAAAKEFALFLKKRSSLEEEHAHGLRKLCRMTQESIRRPEHRQGTFSQAYDEMLIIHDRMADNGLQFATSLHTMHDDLMELASIAERNRKGWKTEGLAAEQRVSEVEAAVRKSKAKYDSLAEEYERARTGDTSRQSGKLFFKAPKSAAQHEEDLLRKVQGADQDYHGRVQHLQAEKGELLQRTRPEAVKALKDLVRETDSGLSLQMQKFASFNEKLLLSNGLCISPIKGNGHPAQQPRSLREAVAAIDNDKDLNDYLVAHHSKVPHNQGEVKYVRNPVLNQPAHAPVSQPAPHGGEAAPPPGQYPVQPPVQPAHGQFPGGGPGSPVMQAYPPAMGGPQQQRPSSQQQHHAPPPHQAQQHSRNFSTGNMLNQAAMAPHQQQHQPQPHPQPHQYQQEQGGRGAGGFGNGPGHNGPSGSISSQGPPQLGALSFQSPGGMPQPPSAPALGPQAHQRDSGGVNPLLQNPSGPLQGAGGMPPPGRQQSPPAKMMPPPKPITETKPVFGLTLSKLYERDALVVPMVVYQCIQAVDLFGLNMEGIYRQSGSMNSINKLKAMFDADSTNPALDFRNPENFFHDVNSVTGLLKQFFRDLPDPLLTMEHQAGLIEAAKHEDDIVRRDSLHAIINSLPDPNYATLRTLSLHLYRVMENSHVNRMNSHNLSVIFGPTLLGNTTNIADAGWQIKVIDTILQNTYEIFDEE